MPGTIDQLIVCSPYEEPDRHWRYERESRTFSLEDGRRPAGYVVATPGSKSFDDPGVFKELPLVNRIRPRIRAWREAGYPGVTGTTAGLLQHWRDPELFEARRFFFCQLEAIETLIWLTEAPAGERQGFEVPGDGGPFTRLCAKMATGSGKTLVMAMAIAWHILNRIANPQDPRFSRHVLVIAPGLTVRKRLAVLEPSDPGNYYERFDMVPAALRERLRQGQVLVRNWHALNWESDDQLARRRSVDKRGAKSDAAYVKEVLGRMASASNLLVINDEAHHAWRLPAGSKVRGVAKADIEEATRWIGGLDRIHRSRGVLGCYDFSATPFAPSGRESTEEALFDWIVSDFSLNDAIESGLVKTPRVVVRDDGLPAAATYRSKLYHIYQHVRDDLGQKAEPHVPLPDLVMNGYYLLGKDWLETARRWAEARQPTPPVMITVANRTETAARVHHAFVTGKVHIDELAVPDRTLHIDSRVLEKAEARVDDDDEAIDAPVDQAEEDDDDRPVRKLTKEQQAERLRIQVDTVGQPGKPGERVQNVISVGMLTEGWDARTVTHIMGLRAFSSQLLCEQVVGRGLRRTSYELEPNGLFKAEYVNIFGIPFTFLPHEGGDDVVPPPPAPKSRIEALPDRLHFEITWPSVIRIEHTWAPRLALHWPEVPVLRLEAAETATIAGLAPVVEGKPDVSRITEIDLDDLARRFRMQRLVFEAARDVFDQMAPTWAGSREVLLAQVVRLVEEFLASDRLAISPALFSQDDRRRRILLTLSMSRIVRHLWGAIRHENTQALTPVFDGERPLRSTGDMLPWYTGRPWADTARSHVNRCVLDSTWEASEAFALDRHPQVDAWVKNDHLGFEIAYVFDGVVRKYRPDFLVRLKTGTTLVLEVKGLDSPQNQAKRAALHEWIHAVTEHGGFGRWTWGVSKSPSDILDVVAAAARA
ncbi:MAG TPA: DEAD/DEAH box helicase family protein [Methylomirabilota bacterium]|nr:DEAD/DEAH box helicase family protein [Methylomirabilota bacterium]